MVFRQLLPLIQRIQGLSLPWIQGYKAHQIVKDNRGEGGGDGLLKAVTPSLSLACLSGPAKVPLDDHPEHGKVDLDQLLGQTTTTFRILRIRG